MPDKYGLELDLNITKFKSKLKDAMGVSQNFTKQIDYLDRQAQKLGNEIARRQELKIDTSKAEANLEKVQNKLDRIMEKDFLKGLASVRNIEFSSKAISSLGSFKVMNEGIDGVMTDIKGDTDYVAENFLDIANNTEEATENVEQLGKSSKNTGDLIAKSFNKSLKSIKKWTIGFLGARSVFMLFRKYLGEYSQQNEDFNNKMQLTTNTIVNSLAPAFEWFANVIQYVVIGLARIIELLFGVNILSKTVDNGFKSASKSAKEFNDNLSGLDEISNVSEEQGGLGTSLASQLKALDEFKKKIDEVNKWLESTGLTEFLPKLGQKIKDVWDWCKDHPFTATAFVIGLITLKDVIIPGLITGIAGSGGLIAVMLVLAGISIAGLIDQWNTFKGIVNDTKEGANIVIDTIDAVDRGTEKKSKELIDNIKEGQYEEDELHRKFNIAWSVLDDKVVGISDDMSRLNKETSGYRGLVVKAFTPEVIEAHEKAVNSDFKAVQEYVGIMEAVATQTDLTEDEQDRYRRSLLQVRQSIIDTKQYGNDYAKTLRDIDTALARIDGIEVDTAINVYGNAVGELDYIWNMMQKIGGSTIHISEYGSYFGGGGRSHAMGGIFTGSSWQPITAYAGGGLADEGQYFIAREAGPELVGTIGGHTAVMNNDQIVASVSAGVYDAVVSAMSGQSDRPIVLNIDGREFAKVTYSDYQAESSRRGTNTALRRY